MKVITDNFIEIMLYTNKIKDKDRIQVSQLYYVNDIDVLIIQSNVAQLPGVLQYISIFNIFNTIFKYIQYFHA